MTVTVFTVGHSTHTAETFIALLRESAIKRVFDVRSIPYSQWNPHFGREALARWLPGVGIDYIYVGDGLGGLNTRRDRGIASPRLDQPALQARPNFEGSIHAVLESARVVPTTLMCAEENPRDCHRSRLLTPALHRHRATVVHLRAGGRRAEVASSQGSLFD